MLFELLWNGQSPGKRLLTLRVVRADGQPLGPPRPSCATCCARSTPSCSSASSSC
jgi:hypothetical protein